MATVRRSCVMPRVPQLGLAFLLGLTLSSCSDQGRICTDIGCYSGLEIQVNPAPTIPFRIEAFVPGSSALYTQDCANAADCTHIFLPEFTPDDVSVRLIAGGDTTFLEDAQPQYTELQPNGPGCPPICRVGHITIGAPSP